MSRLRFAALVLAASALSACQDPAGVGLGLIDEEGADPTARTVFATGLDTVQTQTTAIGSANPADPNHEPRVLVGDVADALFGDVRATAYVDFVQSGVGNVQADDVEAVWLELRRDYVYGDTTTALPVALRQVTPSPPWAALQTYPADTTFATGDVLTTATVVVADTLVRFDLPATWVTANAGVLVGEDFDTTFEGFALEAADAPEPGVVFGFSTLATRGSRLNIVTVTDTVRDTVSFALREVFSSIQREDAIAPPPTVFPAQAYVTGGVRFDVDLSPVGPLPVARGSLRLPLDRSVGTEGPFVRPIATRSGLFAVRASDSLRVFVGDVVVGDAGDARTLNTSSLTSILQEILLGDQVFDRFEIVPAASGLAPVIPVSLDVLPVLRSADPEAAPRFTLTVIGQPAT